MLMDRNQVEQKAKELVDLAEGGDKFALTLELNRMDPQDRLAVAREMDRLNEQRRSSDPDLPDIEITTSPSEFPGGPHELSDLQIKEERAWYNPLRWFGDKYAHTDVYDPPEQN